MATLRSAEPEPLAKMPAGGAAAPDAELVSLVSPTSFEAEQYRVLRHVVEQRHRDTGLRLIAVTSPGGGDGKTTTAINLAGALAQAPEARVLIVEADLRRPGVLRQLGLGDHGRGLVEAVVGGGSFEDMVRRVPSFNLSVLPAGTPPLAPYEVLKSPRLAQFLTEARRNYDYILLDTPPVVPCPDYRLLEKAVDGTLLVVAANRTPRAMVTAAVGLLDPAKTLGLVFNGDDGPGARYQDHYYEPRRRPRWWSLRPR
jgi:protein-tyrosine kinase